MPEPRRSDRIREATAKYRVSGEVEGVPGGLLDTIVSRVVEAVEPDRIILFGSAARGDLTPYSDIDLLVIKAGVKSRRRLEGEIHMNLFGIDASVDVIVVTPEDVERLKGGLATVIGPALREGIEVYDRDAA